MIAMKKMMTRHKLALPGKRAALTFAVTTAVGFMLFAGPGTAAPPAQTTGNAATGGKLFLQCRACHTVNPGGANGVGPNLAGVLGSKAAARKGYVFSPALTKSGITWSPANMDAWLKRPSALVPGNKMVFAGVADAKARADIIAYLATLKGK